MSERLFEAFREEAERLTELPAFELIERQGHARRRRRQALVATFAACVLAVVVTVAGIVALAGGTPRTQQPTSPDTPTVSPFPVFAMTTLAEGAYQLAPSVNPSRPLVRLTVPPGWNAWQGPNRFEGIGPAGSDNDVALDMTSWYAGVLVLEVEQMAAPACSKVSVRRADADGFVEALAGIPHLKVIDGPDRTTRFGHPATHLRLQQRVAPIDCAEFTFSTLINPAIGLDDVGAKHDAWVVEVEDRPFLVWATWTPGTPREEVDDLLAIVDTIEVVDRE